MLKICKIPRFQGQIVSLGQEQNNNFIILRSYDHYGRSYGWIPAEVECEWAFDVECLQGRRSLPLFPGIEELPFLCIWTRAESIAKFTGIPIILIWKRWRSYLHMGTGTQDIVINDINIKMYTEFHGDLVFTLARS